MNQQHNIARKAFAVTLFLTIPFLFAVCALVTNLRFAGEVLIRFPIQILTGFLMMYLFCELVTHRLFIPLHKNFFISGLFGIAVFLVGVTTSSASSMVTHRDFDLFSYVVKPLYWVGIIGAIPAFIVGVIFFTLIRYFTTPQNTAEQDAAANP